MKPRRIRGVACRKRIKIYGTACLHSEAVFATCFREPKQKALLKVPSPAIAKCQPYAKGQTANGRNEQYKHCLVNCFLSFLCSGLCRSITHRAGLPEGTNSAEQKANNKNGGSKLHFTPSERMRNASGKKININERQATSAHIVSHIIREISYFMCMKKPMIKAAFISDKPIRIVSIRIGCIF